MSGYSLIQVGIGNQDYLIPMATVDSVIEIPRIRDGELLEVGKREMAVVDGRKLLGQASTETRGPRGVVLKTEPARILGVDRIIGLVEVAESAFRSLPGRSRPTQGGELIGRLARVGEELLVVLNLDGS